MELTAEKFLKSNNLELYEIVVFINKLDDIVNIMQNFARHELERQKKKGVEKLEREIYKAEKSDSHFD